MEFEATRIFFLFSQYNLMKLVKWYSTKSSINSPLLHNDSTELPRLCLLNCNLSLLAASSITPLDELLLKNVQELLVDRFFRLSADYFLLWFWSFIPVTSSIFIWFFTLLWLLICITCCFFLLFTSTQDLTSCSSYNCFWLTEIIVLIAQCPGSFYTFILALDTHPNPALSTLDYNNQQRPTAGYRQTSKLLLGAS